MYPILRAIKNEMAQFLTPDEERRMSDFSLSVAVPFVNGQNTVNLDFLAADIFGNPRFTKKDLFIGSYGKLEYKVGKTGVWKNAIADIPAANADVKGMYEAKITTRGGAENMIDGLLSSDFEKESNHQGTVEASPRDRALLNGFVINGDGEFTGVIQLPNNFGTAYSVDATDANQVYIRFTFKGIRLRNYAHEFESENWSSVPDFLDALEVDPKRNPTMAA